MSVVSSVTIDGQEYSPLFFGLEISHDIDGRSSQCAVSFESSSAAAFEYGDPATEYGTATYGEPKPQLLREIIILDDEGERLFAGFITDINRERVGRNRVIFHLHARGYNLLLESTLCTKSYQGVSDRNILQDIFATDLQEISAPNETVEQIEAALDVASIGNSVASAVDNVASQNGATWWVDNYKKFHHIAPTSNPSAWDLTNEPFRAPAAFDGIWSLQMERLDTDAEFAGIFNQVGNISNGGSYTVSVWVQRSSGATVRARLRVDDGTGANAVETALTTPKVGAWQQISVTYVGNATLAARIRLVVDSQSGQAGAIFYDKVEISGPTTPTGQNNFSFEDGDLTDWTEFGAATRRKVAKQSLWFEYTSEPAESLPQPANRVVFRGGFDTGGQEIVKIADDSTSQAILGRVFTTTIIDRSVNSAAVAQLRANIEVAQRGFPEESLSVSVTQAVDRRNLLAGESIDSEDFSGWTPAQVTVEENVAQAPNDFDSDTADAIVEDGTNAQHFLALNLTTMQVDEFYTFSCHLKPNGRSFAALSVFDTDGTEITQSFDVANGAFGAFQQNGSLIVNRSVARRKNGWYRCSLTVASSSGVGAGGLRIYASNADGISAYTGDSASGVLVWGAQFEQGTKAGPYRPAPQGSTILFQVGQRMNLTDVTREVEKTFVVRALTIKRIAPDTLRYDMELGADQRDLTRMFALLNNLAKDVAQPPVALPAPDSVGTAQIQDAAITNLKLAAQAVDEAKLAVAAVTEAILAAGAVTQTKISDNAISTPKLQAGSVVAVKLAAASVVAGKVAADAIVGSNIQAGSITSADAVFALAAIQTADIANLAVTNAKIQNAAIDDAKISSLAADKITAGFLSVDRLQVNTINGDRLLTNTVPDSKIASLSADKITAGTITATISITSPNITSTSGPNTVTLANGLVQVSNGSQQATMANAAFQVLNLFNNAFSSLAPGLLNETNPSGVTTVQLYSYLGSGLQANSGNLRLNNSSGSVRVNVGVDASNNGGIQFNGGANWALWTGTNKKKLVEGSASMSGGVATIPTGLSSVSSATATHVTGGAASEFFAAQASGGNVTFRSNNPSSSAFFYYQIVGTA